MAEQPAGATMERRVIDTTAVIAVIANEAHRARLIELTRGTTLIAPRSLHWEVGNAFSAMFRRRRLTLDQALLAVDTYRRIPIEFIEVAMERALHLAADFGIYAYDA